MEWLEEQGIKYQEVDASSLPDITAVPVTEIGDNGIIGVDRAAIKAALAAETPAKAA